MSDLRSFQLTVAKVLTGLGIVHVPVLAAICAMLGRNVAANAIACALLALIPIALTYAGRSITTIAFGIAITLVGQTSLLVFAFSGHPWQVEMHFYYFAVLATGVRNGSAGTATRRRGGGRTRTYRRPAPRRLRGDEQTRRRDRQ